MPLSPYVHRRIARRMQRPLPGTSSPWTPPAIGELIARIETALARRTA